MPVKTRKRKREESKEKDDAPIPAALIPAKKRAKTKKKGQPAKKGTKRKGETGNEPKSKKAKTKTPTKVESGNRQGEKPEDFMKGFVDPLIFESSQNAEQTKASKKLSKKSPQTTPVPEVPPSSVPPRVGFQVTPKNSRSPIVRQVTPFPRKENLLMTPQEETKLGSFRRVTKADLARDEQASEAKKKSEDANESKPAGAWLRCSPRVSSACSTCWKLTFAILLCAIAFPLFGIDIPLSATQGFLQPRMEKWLLTELRKEKGEADCTSANFVGLFQADAIQLAKNKFGNRFDEERIIEALSKIMVTKDNGIEWDGKYLSTRMDAIKSKECINDEVQIERIREYTIEFLRAEEGKSQCRELHFQERSGDERFDFAITDIQRAVYDTKFNSMPEHNYERLFNRMIDQVRRSRSDMDELKVRGRDIYTTLKPTHTLVCLAELWMFRKKWYILGFFAVIGVIAYLWYKNKASTKIAIEATRVFDEVIQHLENKSREVSTWVPIRDCRDLIHGDDGDQKVWAEVEKRVAKSNHINKGIEMVDGMEQQCWKVKLHHS